MSSGPAQQTLTTRVEEAIADPLAALGLDLEAVEITPAGKRRVLRVAVDQDGGVTLDDVAEATRVVDRTVEDADLMGQQPYTLEVTSRGVDRPLTLPRHWRRNRGRLVRVTRADGTTLTGRVTASDDTGADLDVSGRTERVGYDEVGKALVQVELNPPKNSDADEPEEHA